jgi:flagellar protein FliO/FliZ
MKWIGCLLIIVSVCTNIAQAESHSRPNDLSLGGPAKPSTEDESLQVLEQDFKKAEAAAANPHNGTENKIEAEVKPSANGTNSADELDSKKPLRESDIPLFTKASQPKSSSSNPFFRMMIALVVICGLGLGTLVYAKRFKKTNKSASKAPKIQVLTQHFLGPKKSLAIVKIAGESILIGVTDHNITPIRVLSLLDDELPPAGPRDFNAAMQGVDFIEDTVQDEFRFHLASRPE